MIKDKINVSGCCAQNCRVFHSKTNVDAENCKSNVNIHTTYNFSNKFKLSVGTDLVSILKKNSVKLKFIIHRSAFENTLLVITAQNILTSRCESHCKQIQ